MQFFIDLFMNLIPPDGHDGKDPPTSKRHRNWRRTVFLCSLLTGAALTYGCIKYATAAEVDNKISTAIKPLAQSIDKLNQKVDAQANQLAATNKLIVSKISSDLEKNILDTQILLCKGKTSEGVDYFRQRLIDLKSQYQDITGREYRVPHCEDL